MKLKYKIFNWLTDNKIAIKEEEPVRRSIDLTQWHIKNLEDLGYKVTKQ
jgi:hypothetical protein